MTAKASSRANCWPISTRAGLSRYDMPEYFIALSAFPLTASGKILKRELVRWAKDGEIAPTPVRWHSAA